MPIILMDIIERRDLVGHSNWLFVFGDNFAGVGRGGQAAECRGEPNAVGIATKRAPSMAPGAFLSDADINRWRAHNKDAFALIETALETGKTVVLPSAGIGTGRAELEQRAPLIWAELQVWLDKLKQDHYVHKP